VGKPEGKRPLGRPRRRWEDNIKMDFLVWYMGAWIKAIWLRIGSGGGRLWMRQWTFGFHKMRWIPWLAENQLASQEGLCSMEWVSNETYKCSRLQYVLSYTVCVCILGFVTKVLNNSVLCYIFKIIIQFELSISFFKVLSVWYKKTSQNTKSKWHIFISKTSLLAVRCKASYYTGCMLCFLSHFQRAPAPAPTPPPPPRAPAHFVA